jgi:hypothetical protein
LHFPDAAFDRARSITVDWRFDPKIETIEPFDTDSVERKQAQVALIYPRDF